MFFHKDMASCPSMLRTRQKYDVILKDIIHDHCFFATLHKEKISQLHTLRQIYYPVSQKRFMTTARRDMAPLQHVTSGHMIRTSPTALLTL